MASVTCKLCNTEYAVIGCDECKTLVCGNCSAICQGCGVSVCTEHTNLTKGGRKLCHRCVSERQARRQALKEKYSGVQPIRPPTPQTEAPAPAKPPGSPVGASPYGANVGAAFADIAASAPKMRIQATEEEIEEEAGLGPEHDDPEMRLDPEEAEKNQKALDVAGFTSTGRLELPPMDENRAVLGQSGYQPPTRKKIVAAFVFFGFGMMLFYNTTPYFKDTLFPFKTTKLNFNEGQMAQIQDTNKLRNTSNIQQFDIFSQAPMFFLAWLIVLAYAFGIFILILGIIRSSYWSYFARQNLKAAQNLDKDANTLQKL